MVTIARKNVNITAYASAPANTYAPAPVFNSAGSNTCISFPRSAFKAVRQFANILTAATNVMLGPLGACIKSAIKMMQTMTSMIIIMPLGGGR